MLRDGNLSDNVFLFPFDGREVNELFAPLMSKRIQRPIPIVVVLNIQSTQLLHLEHEEFVASLWGLPMPEMYQKGLHRLAVNYIPEQTTLQKTVARLSIIVLGNKVRKMGWTLLGKDI